MVFGTLGLIMTNSIDYIVILRKVMEKNDFQQLITWFPHHHGQLLEARKEVLIQLKQDSIVKARLTEMTDKINILVHSVKSFQ